MKFSQVEASRKALRKAKASAKARAEAEAKSQAETVAEIETMMVVGPTSNQSKAHAVEDAGPTPTAQTSKVRSAAPLTGPAVVEVGSYTPGTTPTPSEAHTTSKGKSLIKTHVVSFPPGIGHSKVRKLLTYANILEFYVKLRRLLCLARVTVKIKRKRVESTASSEFEASEGNEESPPWNVYSTSNIQLTEPYTGDYEPAGVPCPKKIDISLLRNEGYMGFFAKTTVPLIDRQFMSSLDPLTVAEILQSNTVKVRFFYMAILILS